MIKIIKYGEVSPEEIFARSENVLDVAQIVSQIIENVKANGDAALIEYCKQFEHSGFVSRIDRNYQNAFGSVNEVNLRVMHAVTTGLDVDSVVDEFFREFYGEAGPRVKKIMEKTEENQKKIFYLNGYYFTYGILLRFHFVRLADFILIFG